MLKEWKTHNDEALKVKEESAGIVKELREGQKEASLALKIARDLANGRAAEVKKTALTI